MKKRADIRIGQRANEEAYRLFQSIPLATAAVGCGRNVIYEWMNGVAPSAMHLARMHELGADIIYILTGQRKDARNETVYRS